ncbi:DUF899 domain-containing protein [soil metagenome]
MSTIAKPPVASQAEWLAARLKLLKDEKELTRQKDRVNAERRRLPMVKVEKEYVFDGPNGEETLSDLFEGKRQLVIYHFMFAPEWEEGCPGCTGYVDALGDLSDLGKRDTAFVLVSRAPLEKLDAYKAKRGWDEKWVSSGGSDFNYDYGVSFREGEEVEYNYALRGRMDDGEGPGTSVFFKDEDGTVYHTYSSYARGAEGVTDSYSLLDLTPYGRQEDFEDSPAGWPQKPTYG